ncbi:Fibronectin-attachment protein (FAP) [Rhodococcus triatomae]|uniref:Alanine and proline-rich secreted protein Apa n=1 Tax=Rhodococcus triatomae TaxID=300028 RepID=A0A1G8NA72_9NOCA|nr:Fibronectin-attachment protein (FAP) [Rhodococcus triatomae]
MLVSTAVMVAVGAVALVWGLATRAGGSDGPDWGTWAEDAEAGVGFVVPTGWSVQEDDEPLFGQVMLHRDGDAHSVMLLGRLDGSLFASAESDTAAAASSLASGMGEFFFPDSGQRIDLELGQVSGEHVSGSTVSYRVDFAEPSRDDAEIHAAVVERGDDRWWLVWFGDIPGSVDRELADAIAGSFTPLE